MAKYGYVRVSTFDQNEDRQLDAMAALGIPADRIFMEKVSGKTRTARSFTLYLPPSNRATA